MFKKKKNTEENTPINETKRLSEQTDYEFAKAVCTDNETIMRCFGDKSNFVIFTTHRVVVGIKTSLMSRNISMHFINYANIDSLVVDSSLEFDIASTMTIRSGQTEVVLLLKPQTTIRQLVNFINEHSRVRFYKTI